MVTDTGRPFTAIGERDLTVLSPPFGAPPFAAARPWRLADNWTPRQGLVKGGTSGRQELLLSAV